jgi:hypothetical protein
MKKFLVALMILFWAGVSWGATYNIGPGQTYTTFAALVAGETLAAGDIVDGGGNTFTEVWTIPTSGSIGNPITFRNATVWEIFGNSQDYITVQGLVVTGNIHASGDNWVIDRVVCDGDAQTITFKSTTATIDLDLTTTGGAVLWAWGDESSSTSADPGLKDFGGAATRYSSVSASGKWANVTRINTHNTAITFYLSQLRDLSMTGSLFLNGSNTYGDLACLPRGLDTDLYMVGTGVYGDMKDLPAGLSGHISLQGSAVNAYTATSWPCATANNKNLNFSNMSLDQTAVDNILCHLDAQGATGGTLNLGTTTAPSAAGLVCADNLGGKGWIVTVTP